MKENDGRGARRKFWRRLIVSVCVVVLCTVLLELGIRVLEKKPRRQFPMESVLRRRSGETGSSQRRLPRIGGNGETTASHQVIQEILQAKLHLVDLKAASDEMGHVKVNGIFCQLDWAVHKQDPSATPMFRDLVAASPACNSANTRYTVDLNEIYQMASNYQAEGVHSLELGGVVFHESRCGSTLVANTLQAMNPKQHRVYSESAPPIAALRSICGENYETCSLERAAELLQQVVHFMGRSNDPHETRVFFKIQSVGTRNIPVFLKAFPTTPWLFVYRDPVQVLMSHLEHGEQHANCLRSRKFPPAIVDRLVRSKSHAIASTLSAEDYCAAHLATITETALHALQQPQSLGHSVNYQDLPQALYQDILPHYWKIPVGDEELERIQEVSGHYAKGRGGRKAEWKEDSQHKDQMATDEIRQAASVFLQDSFEGLAQFHAS